MSLKKKFTVNIEIDLDDIFEAKKDHCLLEDYENVEEAFIALIQGQQDVSREKAEKVLQEEVKAYMKNEIETCMECDEDFFTGMWNY